MPSSSWTWRTVLGPTPGIRSSVDEAGRDLRAEPVVVGHAPGRGELRDLVADRLADARDRSPVAGAVRGNDVERGAGDGVRGAVVGDRLEHDLALDLEDVADLVEDPGEVAVGERMAGGRLLLAVQVLGEVRVGGRQDGRVVAAGHRTMVRGRRRCPARCRAPALALRGALRRDHAVATARASRGRAPGPPRRSRGPSGSSGSSATATPTETDTPGTPMRPRSSPRTARRTRSPTSTATSGDGFLSRTANSSPPNRAGTSSSRTAPAMAWATSRSTSSPTACPKVSLSRLNRSMSIIRTPTRSSARRRRASSVRYSSK